ncbi:unnamed protein product [Effrenium voratum]|uniref:MORN repeat-containing protein 3 n=1 Tax=Effrenium voratum TaxID=2562239 RepID=A0AA36HTG6_9DINO|nr:unnamed protein product [Effrenium voratum]
MVGLCGSFVVKLRQQKLRKEAQIQRLKEKNFVDTRSEEQKVHDLWMEALTDEKGHFITGYKELQLPDGSLYSGQLENGDPQGVGKMIWPDGRTFRGKWLRGQPHGHGVMCSMAPQDMEYDTWVYCGQFTDGLRNGVGRCEWPAVGSWYEGDWLMDGEHGLGELGAGATESQDGDPQIWSMYNGEKQENVAQSRVVPGLDDELMVVVLQAAKDLKLSELDDTELLLPRYGMAVGNPHVWIPRHEHAFLVTWIEEEGPLDAWNRAQLRQAGPGAKVVLPNCTVWSVNGIRGNISKMTEELLSPTQTSLTLEVWCPAHQRLDSMRDDLAKRAGWFRTPGDQMNFVGLRWTQKSKHARELETARPWMKTALNVPNVEAHTETRSGLERSPARMTDRPGLPALLRMPEVPAPPTHLVASVTLKASKAEAALPSPTSLSKEAPRSKVEAPVPKLRWPQAPPAPSEAPPAAAPFVEEQDERLRRVAEATTPPMSPH